MNDVRTILRDPEIDTSSNQLQWKMLVLVKEATDNRMLAFVGSWVLVERHAPELLQQADISFSCFYINLITV